MTKIKEESFFSSFKVLAEEGYLKVAGIPKKKASQTATKDSSNGNSENTNNDTNDEAGSDSSDQSLDTGLFEVIKLLKKGAVLQVRALISKKERHHLRSATIPVP